MLHLQQYLASGTTYLYKIQFMIKHLRKILQFSFRKLEDTTFVSVPYEQQMLSYQQIEIADGSELEILGEVIITV